MIAVAVNTDGVREILGATGPSEAEPFWTDFLRGHPARLTRCEAGHF